jgi:hypothetical protein
MNLNHIKQRIVTARSVGLDFVDSTPPEVQSALMDLASIAEHLLSQRGVAPLMSPEGVRALNLVTRAAAVDYEVRGSWWAMNVGGEWLQRLAGRWFAFKVRRKWGRYSRSLIVAAKYLTDPQTRR